MGSAVNGPGWIACPVTLPHDIEQVNQTPSSREDNISLLDQLWRLIIIVYAVATSPWTVIMATKANKLITVTAVVNRLSQVARSSNSSFLFYQCLGHTKKGCIVLRSGRYELNKVGVSLESTHLITITSKYIIFFPPCLKKDDLEITEVQSCI